MEAADPNIRPYLEVVYEPNGNGAAPGYSFLTPDVAASGATADPEAVDGLDAVNVNVANGNLLLRAIDSRIADVEPAEDLLLERFYNSSSLRDGSFGRGWSMGLGPEVTLHAGPGTGATFVAPSQWSGVFARRADGTFQSPRGLAATLAANGTGYRLDLDDEQSFSFPAFGSPVSSYAEENVPATTLTYASTPQALALSTATGRENRLQAYTVAGTRRLDRIETQTGRVYRYGYAASGDLSTFTPPTGPGTTYGYDTQRRLNVIDRPDGSRTTFTYVDATSRKIASVVRITDKITGAGETTRFTYGAPAAPCDPLDQIGSTTTTDPTGRSTVYCHDSNAVVRRTFGGSGWPTLGLAGSLPTQDRQLLAAGTSYTLDISANDANGVSKIEIEIDGEDGSESDLTSKACSATTCSLSYALNSSDYAPGLYLITARVRDAAGNETTRTIEFSTPKTAEPAADPAEPAPETESERLASDKRFRSNYGLNTDDAYMRTLDADPAARSRGADFGLPLTQAERDGLDLRLRAEEATTAIRAYVASTPAANSAYAGTFIRQNEGGLVYVGFTQDVDAHITAIRTRYAYPDRVRGFLAAHTAAALKTLHDRIFTERATLRSADGIDLQTVATNLDGNRIEVGVPSPSPTLQARLQARYGSGATLVQAGTRQRVKTRYDRWSRIQAGVAVSIGGRGCTAGPPMRIRFDTGRIGYLDRRPLPGRRCAIRETRWPELPDHPQLEHPRLGVRRAYRHSDSPRCQQSAVRVSIHLAPHHGGGADRRPGRTGQDEVRLRSKDQRGEMRGPRQNELELRSLRRATPP